MGSGKRIGSRITRRPAEVSSTDFFSLLIILGLTLVLVAAGPSAVPAQTPETITLLGKIPTDRMIDQVALAPGSRIAYGITYLAETLYIFDLETYQVRKKVALGRKPVGLIVDPRTNLALVIAGGDTRSGQGGTLWAITPQGQVQRSLPLAETPRDLALDPETGNLVIAAEGGEETPDIFEPNAGKTEGAAPALQPPVPGFGPRIPAGRWWQSARIPERPRRIRPWSWTWRPEPSCGKRPSPKGCRDWPWPGRKTWPWL